jgi:hypothetical protein
MWMFVVASNRAGQTVYREQIRHSTWGAVRIYICFHDARISRFELPKALTYEPSLSKRKTKDRILMMALSMCVHVCVQYNGVQYISASP